MTERFEQRLRVLENNIKRVAHQNKCLLDKKHLLELLPKVVKEKEQLRRARDQLQLLRGRVQELEGILQQNHCNSVVESIDRNFKVCNSQIQGYKGLVRSMEKQIREGEAESKNVIREEARKSKKEVEQRLLKNRKFVDSLLDDFKLSVRAMFEREVARAESHDFQKIVREKLVALEDWFDEQLGSLQAEVGYAKCKQQFLEQLQLQRLREEESVHTKSKAELEANIRQIRLKEYIKRGKAYLAKTAKQLSQRCCFLERNGECSRQEHDLLADRLHWLERLGSAFAASCGERLAAVQKCSGRPRPDLKKEQALPELAERVSKAKSVLSILKTT